jgi:hypothetical protein
MLNREPLTQKATSQAKAAIDDIVSQWELEFVLNLEELKEDFARRLYFRLLDGSKVERGTLTLRKGVVVKRRGMRPVRDLTRETQPRGHQ